MKYFFVVNHNKISDLGINLNYLKFVSVRTTQRYNLSGRDIRPSTALMKKGKQEKKKKITHCKKIGRKKNFCQEMY